VAFGCPFYKKKNKNFQHCGNNTHIHILCYIFVNDLLYFTNIINDLYMKNVSKYVLYTFFTIYTLLLHAQPAFRQVTTQWKSQFSTRSVIPGAMLDMDGDLIDDVVVLDKGTKVVLLKSNGPFEGFVSGVSQDVSSSTEWTMAAGDLNNDGTPEILTAGEFGPVSVLQWQEGATFFKKTSLPANMYAQGSATVDVNHDGWLDYFVANDVGYSRFYLNDGKGNLQFRELIDFAKGDPTDGSGNYGIEWCDVNLDGLPDLYISKCRAGVDNPEDQRRINRLYLQNADGTFKDLAREYGIDSGDQSWAATFGDLDNDGDPDLFVLNHYAPHQLFENVDGQFFRLKNPGATLQSFGFQVVMQDFDNDGLLDILYTGAEGATLLWNQGNLQFSIQKQPLGPNLIRSFTCGDVNDDGIPDVHAHLGEPINKIGPKPDELWLGESNGNQYVKVALRGHSGNASAIGARLLLHGPWGVQYRYTGGNREVFYSLKSGTTHFVQEKLCVTQKYRWQKNTEIIKANQPLLLSAPEGYASYEWSNGQSTQASPVSEGIWYVRMQDASGCTTISDPVRVLQGCFSEEDLILEDSFVVQICDRQPYTLGSRAAFRWQWSTGDTSQWIQVANEGLLKLTAEDYCRNMKRDSVYVQVLSPEIEIISDTILEGQVAVVSASIAETNWYGDVKGTELLATGSTFSTQPLSGTTTFFARATSRMSGLSGKVGETLFPSSNLYGANSVLGGMVFDAEQPFLLRSVKVNTDTEGKRRIILLSKDGVRIFQKDIFLKTGITEVALNAQVPPGQSYTLTFDETVNQAELGYRSPRLVRTFNTTKFPYQLNGAVTIQSSTFGALYYYYFYDWDISYDFLECTTPLIPVTVVVQPSVIGDISPLSEVALFPNPVDDILHLKLPSGPFKFDIRDMTGQCVSSNSSEIDYIDVGHLYPGVYFLRITTGHASFQAPFIKL